MNKIIRFIPLILFISLGIILYRGLALNPQALPSALVGQKMPEFVLTQLLKPKVMLTEKDLVGDIKLLNVWGTWCVYCKYEHPYLVDIAQSGRVALYGLNYKDDRDDARQWLKDYQDPYQFSIFDPLGKLGIELGVTAAPETFVIDHKGIIRMKHVGPIDGKVWQEKFLPLIITLENELKGETS
ncbi:MULTISPECIES: DsbE family thiol:disulfide interchange protein [Thalassotalea]|uniref:DsbE family thiol:disulfide interchange protein n=1 Tax=Thalassotalea castellviae TaxID=3075612 RepID=A0ABU2ZYW6_9GAMM|nr:DsbE family thiol:disulfide interchange protein [Thalassotalea sp. W431]MDT0603114.1 DsbE family thiol:disulfide interchange protein [Thalassotalea sp. W431]